MDADLIIVGAGAAGLAAAIFAGEAAQGSGLRIVLLDGAKRPGAKILVSGGGRCNVTNERVAEDDYCGGPKPLIRRVLRAFDEGRTREWMASLGVELKVEPTGKLFPVTDSAKTVLEALLHRVEEIGVQLVVGVRVEEIDLEEGGFRLQTASLGTLRARRLIVATGGLALPKSGSDGRGLHWMHCLGHTVNPTTPALVPLVLRPGPEPGGRFQELTGLSLDVRLRLWGGGGRPLAERVGSLLFTHFGVSGPAPMDLSRHWLRARLERPELPAIVTMGLPRFADERQADAWILAQVKQRPRASVASALDALMPERLARVCGEGFPALSSLTREHRGELTTRLTAMPLPVTGDRGYAHAETTAGGVSLREVDMHTMASRLVTGLHLCGEMLDVDGRIGGFSFQWAWASGYLAGRGSISSLLELRKAGE